MQNTAQIMASVRAVPAEGRATGIESVPEEIVSGS